MMNDKTTIITTIVATSVAGNHTLTLNTTFNTFSTNPSPFKTIVQPVTANSTFTSPTIEWQIGGPVDAAPSNADNSDEHRRKSY